MTTTYTSHRSAADLKGSPQNIMKEKKWRQGGMTSNRLRDSTTAINYFTGPGRMNIIPDTNASNGADASKPMQPAVSSIGIVQTNGLGQVSSGSYGPGTLLSSNIQIRNPNITDENTIGETLFNTKRNTFVDYRSTDPALIQNLRKNPLSIYAVGEAKNADIPAFFSYIRPDNYNTYNSLPNMVDIKPNVIQQAIEGSPQVNILGLDKQNPFMGLTNTVNSEPDFFGKTYGGDDTSSARKYAKDIYNQGYTTNILREAGPNGCKNKALTHFAQGYNVAPQIVDNRMVEWVSAENHSVSNLPYGPVKVTGNPRTQQGGIWQRGHNLSPTKPDTVGYQNNPNNQVRPVGAPVRSLPGVNAYKHGRISSLVSS